MHRHPYPADFYPAFSLFKDAFSKDFAYNSICCTNQEMGVKILIKNYKDHLGLLSILMVIGVFLIGLWPYDFFPANKAEWLKDTNGIRFNEISIAYSSDLFNDGGEAVFQSNEITIELWLEPTIKPMTYLAWIFSLVDRERNEYVTFAQWSRHLYIVRDRITDPTLPDPRKKIGIRNTLSTGKKRFITVSSNSHGTAVYIDGTLKKIDADFTFLDNASKGSGRLLLGNSPRGNGQWMGNLLGLAMYDRALGKEEVLRNYRSWIEHGTPPLYMKDSAAAIFMFDEQEGTRAENLGFQQYDLIMPQVYRVIQRGLLKPPRPNFLKDLSNIDSLLHFLGFIPISLFLCAFFRYSTRFSRATSLFSAILISMGLGVTIELLQVYLPSRDAQSLDLICNFLGTVTGVALFGLLSYIGKKDPHE